MLLYSLYIHILACIFLWLRISLLFINMRCGVVNLPVATTTHFYKTSDKLGSGASCDVYKGIQKSSSRIHALKVFKDGVWSKSQENAREIEALTKIKHENIVAYYGKEEEYGTGRGVLVMEYCSGGSLHSYLQEPENCHGLQDDELILLLSHICKGWKHLRKCGFLHRDIKPGNILRSIENDGSVVYKLADFGASKMVDSNNGDFMSLAGTEEYLHPAIYERAFIDRTGRTAFNESVDMWSIGVTIFQACAGDIPFKPFGGVRNNRTEMYAMITCKPYGVISGEQLTPTEDFRWKRNLPETCQLSTAIQDRAVSIIAGLLEAEERRQWSFSTLENAVEKLLKLKKIVFVFTEDSTLHTIYIAESASLSVLQEEIARETEVPAHRQMLFTMEQHELIDDKGRLHTSLMDEDTPTVLVTADETEEHSRSRSTSGITRCVI